MREGEVTAIGGQFHFRGVNMAEELDDKDQPLPEYGEVRDEEQLDWPKLVAYLREHDVAHAGEPLEVLQFHGGHSNLTYLLRFGAPEWVVPRPPVGPLPPSAHDMAPPTRCPPPRRWSAVPA